MACNTFQCLPCMRNLSRVKEPVVTVRCVEEGLTDYGKREAVPKGSHLVIGASTIDLKYGHADKLCQQSRPKSSAVLIRLQMHNELYTSQEAMASWTNCVDRTTSYGRFVDVMSWFADYHEDAESLAVHCIVPFLQALVPSASNA